MLTFNPCQVRRFQCVDRNRRRSGNHSGCNLGFAKTMLRDFSSADHVYIACGYTDLRKGIDGLASLIKTQFRLDPCSNSLFLFCGRRTDRIKALYYEGDGFLLLYKRVDNGRFQWPCTPGEAKCLSAQQFRWLMEGLSVEQPKAIANGTGSYQI